MKNVNKSEGFIDKIATDTRLLRLLYTRNDRGSSLLLSDTKESKEESIVCEISRFVHRSIFDSSHISIHRVDDSIIKEIVPCNVQFNASNKRICENDGENQ